MPWKDSRKKTSYDRSRDRGDYYRKRERSAGRKEYQRDRESWRSESGYYKKRWRKDKRRGRTPEADLKRMYDRFIDEAGPDIKPHELQERLEDFFNDAAGVTQRRRESIRRQAARAIVERVTRDYGLRASASEEGALISNRSGVQRIVDSVFERTVMARPGRKAYVQLVDGRTGRILSQRTASG